MGQNELRIAIRRRIAAGIIPPADPRMRIFGGKSDGSTCDCCNRVIAATEVQYDVEFSNGKGRITRTLTMHLDCHRVWLAESREQATAAPVPQDEREGAENRQ